MGCGKNFVILQFEHGFFITYRFKAIVFVNKLTAEESGEKCQVDNQYWQN